MTIGSCSLVVVDEDPRFRGFVAELFRGAGFAVFESATGEDALQVARRERPDLVVMDVRLPDVNGFEVCQRLRSEFGETLHVVFVSEDRTDPLDRAAGLLVGGDDYLAKPVDADELLARARRLISRTSARRTIASPPRSAILTQREHEVLQLLARGMGTKAIAGRLVVSPKTVASHVQSILGKLGAHTRAEAVAIAYRDGLADALDSTSDEVSAHVAAAR